MVGLAWVLAAGACVHRAPSAARNLPPPAKPRVTASATALTATSEWRSVVSPVRAPDPVPAPSLATATSPGTSTVSLLRPAMSVTAPAPALATPAPPAPVVLTSVLSTATSVTSDVDQAGGYRLRAGDPVVINLRGILPRDEEIECMVDESGLVKVPYLERIKAAGLSTSQLEDEIERRYVDGKIYKSITVGVIMPSQSYFIQGEVKLPGRMPLTTRVTLLQVIAQAGGYTDFADQGDVRIIRAGRTMRFNAKELARFPERDVRIEPGDVVNVTRSAF